MLDIINSTLSEDQKNSWETDPAIFNALNFEFHFNLDAAADKNNHKVSLYLTEETNALEVDWSNLLNNIQHPSVWVNPPYGRGYIKKFMKKAAEQKEKGVTSVLLVPGTLDAKWLLIDEISEIRIITRGRLSFYHPITKKKINGNTKGSMIVIFRPVKSSLIVRLINRDKLLALGLESNV